MKEDDTKINATSIDRWMDEGWQWGKPVDHDTFYGRRMEIGLN